MHRRFSSFVSKSSPHTQFFGASTSNAIDFDDLSDTQSESKMSAATTVARGDESLTAPSLKVKRVDHYYSRWTKGWKYRVSLVPIFCDLGLALTNICRYQNMNAKVTVESIPVLQGGGNDPWKDYSFVYASLPCIVLLRLLNCGIVSFGRSLDRKMRSRRSKSSSRANTSSRHAKT
jgi:hypothetical protein